MNSCSMCGSPIPDGQSVCSMCYGDPAYGTDGLYEEWLRGQEAEAGLAAEREEERERSES